MSQKNTAEACYNLISIFVLSLVFLYSFIRAAVVPVFHDEAYTYFVYVKAPLSVVMSELGNNHILNSLLIKMTVGMFGLNELSLRLPALFGHVLYLVGVYRISRLFLRRFDLVVGTILLTFNPFVLELFSAARGYALALGFFMQACYYFLRSREDFTPRNVTLTAWLLGLAVFSHLTFLYLYVAAMIILSGEIFSRGNSSCPGQNGKPLYRKNQYLSYPFKMSLLLICLFTGPVIHHLKTAGFYHGGTQGFWADTVSSLVVATLYGQREWPQSWLRVVMLGIAGLISSSALFLLRERLKRKRLSAEGRALYGWLSLLILTSLIITLARAIFGIKYVYGRTAVFYIPLFGLFVLCFWKYSAGFSGKKFRIFPGMFLYLLAVLLAANLIASMNIRHFTICSYDIKSKDVISALKKMHQKQRLSDNPVRLGTHFLFVPSLHFYREKNGLTWLRIIDLADPDFPPCHYFYLLPPEHDLVRQHKLGNDFKKIPQSQLTVIQRYPSVGTFLASGSVSVLRQEKAPD